ncbi:MAG: Tricorn protease like protein [Prolixibacteraceae bacterium]|nr:Tricorn protease like protein [Prolixibacteraceae bacterium]MBT6763591.1 Tricorn protease like protein [Prolixibacteraceae bacterium]MBT7000814.1 Tricorn protease like protein [Prolixibacteraceae bacterium]MBT7393738.1 Tricorn protease like protein [Prolixibacteraceae bacterium]
MKKIFLVIVALIIINSAFGQINAKLMRYMDVSETQITFVYGGDIWVMSKTGGTAIQLTHSPGEESWPRFSPDGKQIGFTASYNGNSDVFAMPVTGGVPTRITYNSFTDRMIDWHPNGKQILFASTRENGVSRLSQFFLVDKKGGFPEKLAIPYGELASFSPDGNHLAYITKITENYPFKRYRGGLTSDIIIYNTKTNTTERITTDEANDGKPAWAGNKVYFLSDRDENMRLNIWEYDTKTKEKKQVTKFEDFDISFLSAGPSELIFEMGGDLHLMDLTTQKYKKVVVNVISDLSVEMPTSKDVSKRISNMTASPGGKRIIFEARGELFNVPVKEGYTLNITKSSGAFDQNPAWSPDGKTIAYWSDKSGEYEIYLQDNENKNEARKLTKRGKGFGYKLYWSPNSEKIAFIDETNNISIIDIKSGEVVVAGNTLWNTGHGARFGFPISWSPDSKWITFTQNLDNANSAIFVYNLEEKKQNQVTNGFYFDNYPVFSTDGKYLFYLTNRSMNAAYSDMNDGTWIYPNATQIASLSLSKKTTSILAAKNDTVEIKEEKKTQDKAEPKEDEKSKEEEDGVNVEIDFDNIEARLILLPPKAGNISALIPFEDKLVFLRRPNTGSGERSSSLHFYDLKEREEKAIMENVSQVVATADGKSMLANSQGKYGIIKPAPGQKIEKPIPTNDLVMDLIPKEEWRQIFMDTWRRHRDFFYDPNMHQLDWEALRDQYSKLIEDARTRWDITNLQLNLVSELSAGHTYANGGDVESSPSRGNGFLGIDWTLEDKQYKIKRIVKPAEWDTEVRSPFDQPGVEVSEGDVILSVNGIKLNPEQDPYATFEGLSGKTVSLNISTTGKDEDAKNLVIKCLSGGQERQLRYLEHLENNRKMVDELSDGQLGYIYMSNTAGRGQLELVRMFYGQLDKKGFILDERFNGGGQLADRFLELLQRPVTYNLHWRHGKDHTNPVKTNTGPVGMLINGWAGSGGDGLPWAFQELEAGPIVGERTLGILVGPATGHMLIDGGSITVPGARLYDNDGHWFWEGEGVRPDYKVWDDPNILMKGRDPQMEKVVEEVLKLVKENKHIMTPAPPLEDRSAKGLK